MAGPKMIGTVNGFSLCQAKFGRKTFTFDGTTLGLVRSAKANGAGPGNFISADFGGGFCKFELYMNPRDDRVGGLWARQLFA